MKSRKDKAARSPMTLSDWMELLLDSLCCMAMAVGAMLAFDQLFRFHAEMWVMAVHAAVIVTVLALGTRRKWILPAAIGACLVLGTLGILISGHWGDMITYVQGFAGWWINKFQPTSPYYTEANIMLVQWILHILITAFLFLCVRGIRQVWAMIVCTGILLWIIIINGFYVNNLVALLWIATGMFPLMSRYASARMPRVKGQSKQQRKESRKKWSKPAWYVYATAVVLTAICTVVSMLLLPESTKDAQIRPLANTAEDIQSLLGVTNKMNTGYQSYELTDLGLQTNKDKLGGNIQLNDSTNILKVTTQTPTLLKGRVYTTYDGKSWTADRATYYRLGSSLFQDQYYEAFDLSKPESHTAQALLRNMGANIEMTVTVLRPQTSLLFTAGRLMSFKEAVPAQTPVLFDTTSQVFVNSYPVHSSYRYTFTGQSFWRSDKTLASTIDTLLKEADKDPDVLYNSEEFQSLYLALPEDLPEIVNQTAQELTKGQIRPYDMMVAMEKALRKQYNYSLTPGETPDGEDFVAYFLQTKKGYCVHFASAMTVMARSLGIPARMVSGYGLEQDANQSDLWYARRRNAHTWTECYFEGLGWVSFDPTADSPYAELNQDNNGDQTTTTATTVSTRARFDETNAVETRQSAVIKEDAVITPDWVFQLAITSAIVLVLIVLSFLALRRLRASEIAYLPETVQKRFATPGEQADYYYTDIIRQLKLLHYKPKERETMKQFAARVELGAGLQPDAMRQVFDIMMRWRYGEIEPTVEEVALVEAAHAHLEKRLYDEFNAVHYFFRRRLML